MRYVQLQEVLMDLEAALRQLAYWEDQAPDSSCFKSEMPFCVDTLDFHQWLQFVLIPRLYALIESRASLAIGAVILPMAETVYPKDHAHQNLMQAIEKIDILLAT